MKQCPGCRSNQIVKAGRTGGRQRWKCNGCGRFSSVTRKRGSRSPRVKRLALTLYLEGLGLRSIGRVLGVSDVAVLKWIRAFGKNCGPLQAAEPIQVLEMDELYTYVARKKTSAGSGWLWIGSENEPSILFWAGAAPRAAGASGSR